MTSYDSVDQPIPAVKPTSKHEVQPIGFSSAVRSSEVQVPDAIRSTGSAALTRLGSRVTDGDHRPAMSLVDRVPGQSVIGQVLALQAQAPPRSWRDRMAGTSPLSPQARPWYQGAVGEIAVGKLLARLGPEWTVLHVVPVGTGASDIDHVLIGPGGVFTLNTKNHSGQPVWVAGRTLMVSGQRQPHIPKAAHEAARAQQLLTTAVGDQVPVTGLIVVVGAKSVTVKEEPEGVTVVTDHQLLRWLQRRPPMLASVEVSTIAVIAAQAATWHRDPPKHEDPAALQDGFNALHASVRTARRRRRTWAMLARSVRIGVRLAFAALLIYLGVFLFGASLDLVLP